MIMKLERAPVRDDVQLQSDPYEIDIVCDVESYKVCVHTVSDCVFVGIEDLNQCIPFVEDILRSEPSEVIAVSYDK